MIGNRMKTGPLMAGIVALFGSVGPWWAAGQAMLLGIAVAIVAPIAAMLMQFAIRARLPMRR